MCGSCQLCVIGLYSELKQNGYALDNLEWKDIKKLWVKKKKIMGVDQKCYCGKKITNKFIIKNKIDGAELGLGSTCIWSTWGKLSDLGQWVLNHKCKICNKKFKLQSLYAHNKSKEHIKNIDIRTKNRQCVTCDKFNVKIEYPKWRKQCNKCYAKSNNNAFR